jgi:hypothetical protein
MMAVVPLPARAHRALRRQFWIGRLQQGWRLPAHVLFEAALGRLAGAPDGRGLTWFRDTGR